MEIPDFLVKELIAAMEYTTETIKNCICKDCKTKSDAIVFSWGRLSSMIKIITSLRQENNDVEKEFAIIKEWILKHTALKDKPQVEKSTNIKELEAIFWDET